MQNRSTAKARTRRDYELPPVVEEPGGQGGPILGWSSLEDINDDKAAWPNMINRMAAAACKEKTGEEILQLIGKELGERGISSIFLTREGNGEKLSLSNVTVALNGMAIYPVKKRNGGKAAFMAYDSEIISRVFSFGNVVLTTDPDESLSVLFP
jgi:hypothetical protein